MKTIQHCKATTQERAETTSIVARARASTMCSTRPYWASQPVDVKYGGKTMLTRRPPRLGRIASLGSQIQYKKRIYLSHLIGLFA